MLNREERNLDNNLTNVAKSYWKSDAVEGRDHLRPEEHLVISLPYLI